MHFVQDEIMLPRILIYISNIVQNFKYIWNSFFVTQNWERISRDFYALHKEMNTSLPFIIKICH